MRAHNWKAGLETVIHTNGKYRSEADWDSQLVAVDEVFSAEASHPPRYTPIGESYRSKRQIAICFKG